MKLDINCVKRVLLTIEAEPYFMHMYAKDFAKKLSPEFSENMVIYTCIKLSEAGFIKISYPDYSKLNEIFHPALQDFTVGDLTYFGHDFLEHIRNDKIWNKAKPILEKVGSLSFEFITKVTAHIISEQIDKYF